MMLKVAEYRQHAADCRRMAKTAKDPEQRQMLENMAASWDSLADERDQFLKLQTPAAVASKPSENRAAVGEVGRPEQAP
jgi:hypothetical protein